MDNELRTVNDLIEHLKTFDGNRIIILDDGGNTYPVPRNMFQIWDPNNDESPIGIFLPDSE